MIGRRGAGLEAHVEWKVRIDLGENSVKGDEGMVTYWTTHTVRNYIIIEKEAVERTLKLVEGMEVEVVREEMKVSGGRESDGRSEATIVYYYSTRTGMGAAPVYY